MTNTLKRGDKGPDVFSWQRFLKSQGLYGGQIKGEFDYDTEKATISYQNRNSLPRDGILAGATLQRARWDGFVPASEDRNRGRYEAPNVELSFKARYFLEKIAPEFYDRNGHNLTVTSCIRSPRKQAKAMFDNFEQNQDTPYRNHRAYDEIRGAYDSAQHSGAREEDIIDAMTHVIEEQVARREYISKHLSGEAIDFRNRGMHYEEEAAFRQVVNDAGGRINPWETSHFHVDLP